MKEPPGFPYLYVPDREPDPPHYWIHRKVLARWSGLGFFDEDKTLPRYPPHRRWKEIGSVNLREVPLESLRLFFSWLGQAPVPYAPQWARCAFKAIVKDRRYTPKEWDEVLPREIVTWANGRLAQLAEGELCCDNWRVAQKRNTAQRRRYEHQKAGGCCGFVDVEETGPDGHRYLLGFNCGH